MSDRMRYPAKKTQNMQQGLRTYKCDAARKQPILPQAVLREMHARMRGRRARESRALRARAARAKRAIPAIANLFSLLLGPRDPSGCGIATCGIFALARLSKNGSPKIDLLHESRGQQGVTLQPESESKNSCPLQYTQPTRDHA